MRKILTIVAAAASGLSSPALAADVPDVLWLDSDHNPTYGGDYGIYDILTFSVNGVGVKTTAWSIGTNGKLYQARLGVWDGGLGVKYGSNDNSHTVDNSGTKDFILFQFDKVVELDKARFNTGWHNMNDTDATIGYDTNGMTSPPDWNGKSSSSQFTILDFYDSGAVGNSGNSYRDINPNNYTGDMWLIGASFNNPEGRYKLDGFKIEKLTFTVPTVTQHTPLPEPSTWAMMLIGFFGLGGAMRSRRKRPASGEALSVV